LQFLLIVTCLEIWWKIRNHVWDVEVITINVLVNVENHVWDMKSNTLTNSMQPVCIYFLSCFVLKLPVGQCCLTIWRLQPRDRDNRLSCVCPNITFGGGDNNWIFPSLAEVGFVEMLCSMLIARAPKTQSNVPMIFTLLYVQLKLTFSNLPNIQIFIN